MSGVSEWITSREAAEILGVQSSSIPKMRRRVDLTGRPGGRRPAWSRQQVLELAEARRATENKLKRQRNRGPWEPTPPDYEHEWLLIRPAAVVLGIGANTLSNRVSAGLVPCTTNDNRRWFRLDHLEGIVRSRVAELRRRA
jgi:hypothetical protein